jgi:tRNA threonylcarbamoyladenosine biosynthesis protein TsaB
MGNGVEKWKKLCTHENAQFNSGVLPSAKEMGPLAVRFYEKKAFVDLAYFEPYYLKDFQTLQKT